MQLEARRIFNQHQQLHELHALAARSVGGDDAAAAREAMGQFGAALFAHFEIEEKTHFPALHGLSPATDESLARLVREHVEFRFEIARIEEALRMPDLDSAAEGLDTLARGLEAHEQLEEQLFRETTR